MSEGDVVHREVLIHASAETVFAFLTDAARLLEWMGVEAKLECVPGGLFRVSPNGRDVIRGEFLEVVPCSKVVFTRGYEQPAGRPPPGSTIVEITLEPRPDGTLLRLRHSRLSDAAREGHAGGWAHYLARLQIACEGGDAGPDPLARPDLVHG